MSSLRVFTPEEAELINFIGNALIPKGGTPHYSFEELILDFEVDKFLSHTHKDIVRVIKLMLKAIQYAPLFTRFKKFTDLSEKEREELLEKWEKSKLSIKRNIIIALKGMLMLCYYNHRLVKEAIGFRMKCDE